MGGRLESTQQAPQNSLPSREYTHYKGEGGAEGPEGKGASRLLNRGEHPPRLPRRATPSWRHPLPPPLPVTLRTEECKGSGPSKPEGVHLAASSTPPTESPTLLVSLPHPLPPPSFRPEAPVGPISPPPPGLPHPKQRCPYPFADRSGRSRQAQPPTAPREPLRWKPRSEEEGAWRHTAAPPPPRSPDEPPSPSSATRGGGAGGSEGTTGVEEAPSALGLS